ncbi:5'-nucleotidase domain-containing protein 4 isoform X1 [Herrania umbratica]|uniref:5'-nucleotidase domain-containing protein 4 isoform X1 n=2 Tax=Herrania umbratica TaxID=108875 RepID=A0A6J1AEN1_9ROSI|nr:5'-nucleotidase domain-containing protein 4 isoform X1 [Herrania umbratica]
MSAPPPPHLVVTVATSLPTCNRTFPNFSSSESDSLSSTFPLNSLALSPRCLFSSTMRIPKKPVAFCLSLFFPDFPAPFSSRILRFSSGFPAKIKAIHAAGANQWHAHYSMDYSPSTVLGDKASQSHLMDSSNGGENPCVWSSPEGGCKIDIGKQIFCNRSLNMRNIVAVGFDMDYTLAQYKPETFESLAYEGTTRKLVYDLGYPQELLAWTFDWKYMVRGLVLDKKRGNILKMDRHKYVKVAYHGFRELSKEDKVGTYGNTLIRDSFDEPDYALIDTLFSLAEAYLFAQLVDFKDNNPGKVPEGADYSRMYKDVRAAVDLCHRDGTLKQMVAKDPKRYINEDTSMVPMLKMLRDSGRSTFLVTNSLWDYTNIVMNFLCASRTMDGGNTCNFDWLQYFDVVITGSAKPGFFHDNRANLFEVEPESGMLLNTDNGTPMPRVGSTSPNVLPKGLNKSCRVFQGGSVGHLHKLLSIESSSQVLYVGDHIYGDILRSKKVLGWRTMLVVPELEREVELLWESRDMRKQLRMLRNERDLIEDHIHHMKWSLKFESLDEDEKQKTTSAVHELESQKDQVRLSHQQAQRECHQKFHKIWGQLMKTGYQNSRFAHQVERFACLYTSQVSNLSLYSPDKYYRPSEDFMPHEFHILPL